MRLMEPEMLLVGQTIFLVVLFVSMAFRMKSNYLVHGAILIVTLGIGWVVVFSSLPSFMDSNYTQTLTSPSSTLVMFGLHAFFGFATMIAGTWLLSHWRPRSTDFATKSKRIWQSTVILWIVAYLVGVLLFVALRTAFFG